MRNWTDNSPTYTQQELEAIDQLTALLEENSEDLLDTINLETILSEVDDAIAISPSPTTSFKSSKRKSSFYPASRSSPTAATFLKDVSKDIQEIKVPSHMMGNLTKEESKALKSHMQNFDITIKPADKGGNIII